MILDCVRETEASPVICHAEHVFAIIAFQKDTKRKLNQVKSNITTTVREAVYPRRVYVISVCWRLYSAVGSNTESCSIIR